MYDGGGDRETAARGCNLQISGSADGVNWQTLENPVYFTDSCGANPFPLSDSIWASSAGGWVLDASDLVFEQEAAGSYYFHDTVKILRGLDISPTVYPALTIEIWVKMHSLLNSHGWIVGSDNGGYDRAIALHDDRYGGIAGPNGGVYQSTLGFPPLNQWLHVVATFENGQDCKVYLNYEHQDSRPVNNNDGDGDFTIGGLENYNSHTADAWIASVRIYSRRLTDGDVEQRFQESCGRFGVCRAAGSAICLDNFERVEHWDCGGQDIESVAVEWSDHGDLERCAARCMELGDECVGFNFGSPGSERGDNEPCYMKRDFAPAPACGAASSTWDFYNKRQNDPGCPAHGGGGAASSGGCADGSVEAVFNDKVHGCDTSSVEQGLQEAEQACASGWHVCLDAAETSLNGLTADQCLAAPGAGTFYGTYQSSAGGWDCHTSGQNDIWGCGRAGNGFTPVEGHPCGSLMHALGNNDAGAWTNLGSDTTHELAVIRKVSEANGGVMCCFAAVDEDAGLVSYLTFDEMREGEVTATVGPDAAVTSGTQLDNGALRLDPGGQVNLGSTPELNPTSEMTLCMWVSLLHDQAWHLLATKWHDDGADGQKYFFHFAIENTMLNLYMSADGTSYELVATGESMLAEHGLIHACFTARAGGDVQLFMDGTPVATGTAPARFPSIPAPLLVGCKWGAGDASNSLCGDFIVDEFRFWDRVLSATEIYRGIYLETYNPGWGQLSAYAAEEECPWDVFEVRLNSVSAQCCGADGSQCDPATGLPRACNMGCAVEFVPFYDSCQALLVELMADEITLFDHVAAQCLNQDSDQLYARVTELDDAGCSFTERDALIGRRRTQGLLHHFGSSECSFSDFDDRAAAVNLACCDEASTAMEGGTCSPTTATKGVPQLCSVVCGVEYLPFFDECRSIIEQVLDDQLPAFTALQNRCQHPDVREMLFTLSSAQCHGGWVKLMEDISYSGVAVSDEASFSVAGSWTQLAAVRKSGYIGCNCGTGNPACDGSCVNSAGDCCRNDNNAWNVCEYYSEGVAADNQDAPFEMDVNGEVLVSQPAWGAAPTTAQGACRPGEAVVCPLEFETTRDDVVTLSWSEGRAQSSLGDNCGTLNVDVYGCPAGKSCAEGGPTQERPPSPGGGGH